jgi:hypothetical protein
MNRTIQISTHTTSREILSWLCAHVGEATVKNVFSACGPGWTWYYATGMILTDGRSITRMQSIVFEDDVDADLIAQFALTFS